LVGNGTFVGSTNDLKPAILTLVRRIVGEPNPLFDLIA
jgi:hypothetical protein